MDASTPEPTPWTRVIAIPIVVATVLSLIVLAFLWPARTGEARNLPIVVAGPAAAAEQVVAGLEQRAEGVFTVTVVDDRAAAVEALERRQAYGAIVVVATPEVLTASAASPVAAQALGALASAFEAPVQDVVPLAETDPRGAGLAAAALPLTIGGLLAGVLIALGVRGRIRRLVALAASAVVAGLALTGILQGWLGVLQGDYLVNAGAIALTVLAVGAAVSGLAAVLGRPGVAVAAATLVLGAVPLASAATPVEFLPAPWGAVGQWFPPGAASTLLRDLSYFPAADATFPWLVLAGWAAAGIGLVAAGRR